MLKNDTSRIRSWLNIPIGLLFLINAHNAAAQSDSGGNITVASEVVLFGNHNFSIGGGGIQAGIINTIRTVPMGILSFAASASQVTGADDANYVDGYVRRYGIDPVPFIFPVGDNGNYAPFAAQADGVTGAYFYADPSIAITSKLGDGNYDPLPAGAPFSTASMLTEGTGLDKVSISEYWDIDGTNPTKITLSWDNHSNLASMTDNVDKLTIVGWDGTQWVPIASSFDPTALLGGTSTLTSGSITTNAAIVPGTYTVYTIGALTVPLPVNLTSFTIAKEGQTSHLRWSTTSETNSARFEVEHSVNAKDWNKIGVVEASGNNNILKNYQFVDRAPVNGKNLYRLKMIDLDETFTYTRIQNINFEKASSDLYVYPNPTSGKLNISDYSTVKDISVIDLNGRTIYNKSDSSISNAGVIDLTNLVKGMYMVRITRMNGESTAHKVLITK